MRRSLAALSILALLFSGEARAFVWPSSVERVAHELRSTDVAVRRRAAHQLLSLPDVVVRRVGAPAMGDTDADVRISALEALLGARAANLGEQVVPWLGDPDARVRRAAAEALAKRPSPDAVAALSRVLVDPEPGVRTAAARALGASGSAAAVAPLLGRLDDTEPEVRESVTLALARLGDKGAVVPLVGKIQDSRPNVRRGVALALGALGDARAGSALALALRDPDESVRIAALTALGRVRADDAVVTIVSLLEDERRPQVREAALGALAAIPSDTGIDALIRALSSDDPREKSPARAALVTAGTRAAGKLRACLRAEPEPAQADGCGLALGEIGGGDAAASIAAALRRSVVRPEAALRALASTRDPSALSTVLEFLASEEPLVRRAAIEAAMTLLDPAEPDGRAVEPVARALDVAHARKSERATLVALLGRTGSPRAMPLLVPLAREATDAGLRLAAIEALGLLGRSGQDAVLVSALDDDYEELRLAAALSLRRCAAASTALPLIERLERAAEQDRSAIGLALLGPLSVTSDPAVVERVRRFAAVADGATRDVLIEALAAVPGALGSSALLGILRTSFGPAPRAKVAEALARHPEAAPELSRLATDVDPSVRANAVWSLGALGRAADVPLIERALGDRDAAVSGNAAGALGRAGARGANVAGPLCRSLADGRAYLRANALAGLRAMHARCGDGGERALVRTDPVDFVRAAAARLVRDVPGTPGLDEPVLARCLAEEPSADVASACGVPGRPLTGRVAPVSVYVVPSGSSVPTPRAPFALARSDGFFRLGLTDERGSAYEADAPIGVLRLGIPAALVF